MAWWVYKCNNTQHDKQVVYGDWTEVFDQTESVEWGSTQYVRALAKLQVGDRIIAYQTERNELVGLATVDDKVQHGKHVDIFLKPAERIGVKVRDLKAQNADVAAISAFKQGNIATVYRLSAAEARALLGAAGLSTLQSLAVDDERTYIEGEKRASTTVARSDALRANAKKHWGTKCYCCNFDFGEFYGDFAAESAVVHHLATFQGGEKRESTVNDVRVICPNCHYALHLSDPPMCVDELRNKIEKGRRK